MQITIHNYGESEERTHNNASQCLVSCFRFSFFFQIPSNLSYRKLKTMHQISLSIESSHKLAFYQKYRKITTCDSFCVDNLNDDITTMFVRSVFCFLFRRSLCLRSNTTTHNMRAFRFKYSHSHSHTQKHTHMKQHVLWIVNIRVLQSFNVSVTPSAHSNPLSEKAFSFVCVHINCIRMFSVLFVFFYLFNVTTNFIRIYRCCASKCRS